MKKKARELPRSCRGHILFNKKGKYRTVLKLGLSVARFQELSFFTEISQRIPFKCVLRERCFSSTCETHDAKVGAQSASDILALLFISPRGCLPPTISVYFELRAGALLKVPHPVRMVLHCVSEPGFALFVPDCFFALFSTLCNDTVYVERRVGAVRVTRR